MFDLKPPRHTSTLPDSDVVATSMARPLYPNEQTCSLCDEQVRFGNELHVVHDPDPKGTSLTIRCQQKYHSDDRIGGLTDNPRNEIEIDAQLRAQQRKNEQDADENRQAIRFEARERTRQRAWQYSDNDAPSVERRQG